MPWPKSSYVCQSQSCGVEELQKVDVMVNGEEHTGLEGPDESKCSNVSDSFGSGSCKFTFKEM